MKRESIPKTGTYNGFGERLKLVRGDVAREAFARSIGVHSNTIGRWEREEQYPDVDDLNYIFSIYPDINPAWLILGEGEMRRGEGAPRQQEAAPELDLELMEVIIAEQMRYQFSRDDDLDTPFLEIMALQTASTILNTYKVCRDLSLPASKEVIRKFMAVAIGVSDKTRNKEREG